MLIKLGKCELISGALTGSKDAINLNSIANSGNPTWTSTLDIKDGVFRGNSEAVKTEGGILNIYDGEFYGGLSHYETGTGKLNLLGGYYEVSDELSSAIKVIHNGVYEDFDMNNYVDDSHVYHSVFVENKSYGLISSSDSLYVYGGNNKETILANYQIFVNDSVHGSISVPNRAISDT